MAPPTPDTELSIPTAHPSPEVRASSDVDMDSASDYSDESNGPGYPGDDITPVPAPPDFPGIKSIHIPVGCDFKPRFDFVQINTIRFPVVYRNGRIRFYQAEMDWFCVEEAKFQTQAVDCEITTVNQSPYEPYELLELDVDKQGMSLMYSIRDAPALPNFNSPDVMQHLNSQARALLQAFSQDPLIPGLKALQWPAGPRVPTPVNAYIEMRDTDTLCNALMPKLQSVFVQEWRLDEWVACGCDDGWDQVVDKVFTCSRGIRFSVCLGTLKWLAGLISDGCFDTLENKNNRRHRMLLFVEHISRGDIDIVFDCLKGPQTQELFLADGDLLQGPGRQLVVALARLADSLLLFHLG